MLAIEQSQRRLHHLLDNPRRKIARAPQHSLRMAERIHQLPGFRFDIVAPFAERFGNRHQYLREARASPRILWRKISSAVERLTFRRQKTREWPSALPADRCHRRLVSRIDGWPLVTINLDWNEIL